VVFLALAGALVLGLLMSGLIWSRAERRVASLTAVEVARVSWETDGAYHNPLDRAALVTFFAPGCGTCRIELAALAQVYDPAVLPAVGISPAPYPDSPVEFAEAITGQAARAFEQLYGFVLDSAIVVDRAGSLIAKKHPRQRIAEFYLEQLDGSEPIGVSRRGSQ
jgi:thiol-disulfide isomerase/thioredoxin